MRRVKQYGIRRTGTNYLVALVDKCLDGVEVAVYRGGDKHSTPDALDVWDDQAKHGRYSGYIVSTKNPYAWLLSYREWCHRMTPEEQPDFAHYAINVWNWHNYCYIEWSKCRPTIFAQYERLLRSRVSILGAIADMCEVQVVSEEDITEQIGPAHEEGHINRAGREFARVDYYREKQYLARLCDEDRGLIESEVDWGVAELLGYEREK